ncbi:MAG: 2Fe-2S iron-sulfur cluster-binding protein [Treponemataceae bacterium]
MTIEFILNGEDVVVQTSLDRRLIDILRENFKLLNAKAGCRVGRCGSCSVILNGKVIPSCLVSAFRIRGGEVITLEGFSLTDEYQDIASGFSRAGVENCGYCDAAKILAAEALLEQNPRPNKDEVLSAFNGVLCRCTVPRLLVDGVLAAADIRQRRLYGRAP